MFATLQDAAVTVEPLSHADNMSVAVERTGDATGVSIVVRLHAVREGHFSAHFRVHAAPLPGVEGEAHTVTVRVTAQCMGPTTGTPQLKDYVRCIGHDPDERSDIDTDLGADE